MELDSIYQGDAKAILSGFEDETFDCCVTSPPYWGLRDYGINSQLGLEKTPELYIEAYTSPSLDRANPSTREASLSVKPLAT